MKPEESKENFTLTRVPGVLVGHWTDEAKSTGCTVLLFPEGARCGAVQLGSASGTREMGVFDPAHISGKVHGMCLSGGSAFGLAAADGVVEFLESKGIGFDSGYGKVPIVPAAIIFDLATAKVAGCAVVGGKSMMAETPALQDNINYAFDVLADITGNATIHRGIYEDQRNSLRVYTIIGGLDFPAERIEKIITPA